MTRARSPCAAGGPSKPGWSSSGPRPGWPSKTMPNISQVSRSCQAAPRHSPVAVASAGPPRRSRVRSRTRSPGARRGHERATTTATPYGRVVVGRQPVEEVEAEHVAGRAERREPPASAGTSTCTSPNARHRPSREGRLERGNQPAATARSRGGASRGPRQLAEAVEQRLRARRAARDEDVDGDDLVDALGDRVGVPVRPAACWSRRRTTRRRSVPAGVVRGAGRRAPSRR